MYIGNKRVLHAFHTEYKDTPTQEKSLDITKNGEYEVIPDDKMALSKVNVNVDIPATPTQEKSLDITENGEYEVTPDDDKVLSKVEVNVNIPIKLEDKEITENGTYTASEGYDGLGQVIVNAKTPEQEKVVEITQNGATEIFPDEGYTLSKVTAIVSVGGGENKLAKFIVRSLTEVTAEDLEGLTTIGAYAFAGNESLTRVTIPDTIIEIQKSAFEECKNLETITLPEGVKLVSYSAFYYCNKLKKVILPASIEQIKSNAFNYTPNERETYYNGTIADWCNVIIDGFTAMSFSGLGKLYYKNTSGTYELLTNFIAPDTITEIKPHAFSRYALLETAVIGNNVQIIGRQAFDWTGLTYVEIGDSVISIGVGAFEGCRELTTVTIGSGVTSIDNTSFNSCTQLTNFTIASPIPTSMTFKSSTKLTIDSLKNIINALVDYSGTANEGKNKLTLNATCNATLEAEGATAPDGLTWSEYVWAKGWNLA
jgi:hypothetical protein